MHFEKSIFISEKKWSEKASAATPSEMSFQTDTRLSRQKQIHSLAVYHEAVECVTEGAEYRCVI